MAPASPSCRNVECGSDVGFLKTDVRWHSPKGQCTSLLCLGCEVSEVKNIDLVMVKTDMHWPWRLYEPECTTSNIVFWPLDHKTQQQPNRKVPFHPRACHPPVFPSLSASALRCAVELPCILDMNTTLRSNWLLPTTAIAQVPLTEAAQVDL